MPTFTFDEILYLANRVISIVNGSASLLQGALAFEGFPTFSADLASVLLKLQEILGPGAEDSSVDNSSAVEAINAWLASQFPATPEVPEVPETTVTTPVVLPAL